MSLPGQYYLTIYLHYTSDDNDFDNDTLHISKFIVTPPSAAITQYFTANTYHFNSYDNQPGNSYHWDFGDGSSSDQPGEVHTYPDIDSTYLVVLTVTNACGSATDSIRIQTDGYTTGVNEAAVSRYVKIYPNPATAYLLITAEPGTNLEHYTLTDAGGRPILDGWLSQNKGNVNLENISAGVYLLRISSDKGMLRKKVVVIK
jgi:PKD repeat protein